jgi:NAD(P)-dependent dehydrogenase (short-subunit alcohol dehydrogenase family)
VDIGEVESGVLFDRRVYGNVFNNAKIYKEIAKLEALTKEGKNRVLHVNLKCKGVGKRKQKKGKKGKVNNWISIPAFKANQANAEEIVKAVEELLQRYATEDSEGDESEPEIEDSEVVVAFL